MWLIVCPSLFPLPPSDTSSSEMSQAPCTKPPDRLSTDCLRSQDSLDRLSVDDFWQEVQNIQQSGSDSEQEGSVGDAKQPEGEAAAQSQD